MLRFCTADFAPALLESVAFTVKLLVPRGPVGVPVICPDESMFNPAARLPLLSASVTVPAPPDVVTVWLYTVPCVPGGREVVITEGGDVTPMVTDATFVESAAEVAVTVVVPVLPDPALPDEGAL